MRDCASGPFASVMTLGCLKGLKGGQLEACAPCRPSRPLAMRVAAMR